MSKGLERNWVSASTIVSKRGYGFVCAGKAISVDERLRWNDSVEKGENTRPRVFRPAPSPVGSIAAARNEWCDRLRGSQWWARALATAPEAGALPRLTESFRLCEAQAAVDALRFGGLSVIFELDKAAKL
ncbi:MAG: hypothetical protein ABSA69_02980 [Verrucomicrobiota bacterium]